MIRVCYRCKIIMGEKEPFEDKSETHGLCEVCFPKEREEIKKAVKKYNNTMKGKGQYA